MGTVVNWSSHSINKGTLNFLNCVLIFPVFNLVLKKIRFKRNMKFEKSW